MERPDPHPRFDHQCLEWNSQFEAMSLTVRTRWACGSQGQGRGRVLTSIIRCTKREKIASDSIDFRPTWKILLPMNCDSKCSA